MVNLLKSYVSEFGKEAVFDTDKLRCYLLDKKVDEKYVYQIVLLLSCGNLRDYIQRSDSEMKSVEINNVISGCSEYTGLSMETVKANVMDILLALGVDCAYERMFVFDEDKNKIVIENTAFIPHKEVMSCLELADTAFENGSYSEAVNIYIRLAKAGQPQAMYKLGMCYMDGIGTEKSEQKAVNWLTAAAQNGELNAKAKMGDYYYYNKDISKRNFQKAYECYSAVGAASVNQYVKGNIVNIINQKKVNLIVLVISAVLLLSFWVFTFLCNTSVHNSYNLLWLGLVISSLATLTYVCSLLYYKMFKYNNIKLFITVMTVLWGIYMLALAIN